MNELRSVGPSSTKSLGHIALHTRPGESRLAIRLFELLGCHIREYGPLPGGDDYFHIVATNDADPDAADNIIFISPMSAPQLALERELIRHLGVGTDDPHPLLADFLALKEQQPEFFMHFGIHFASLEDLEDAVERVEAETGKNSEFGRHVQGIQKLRAVKGTDPDIDARMERSRIFAAAEQECYGPNLVQAHVRTDLFSTGLGFTGSVLELDYIFTGAGREKNSFNSL